MMLRNEEKGSGRSRNRWRILGWSGAAVMLLLPLIAMQFTAEVDWDAMDFIVFGTMLAAAGGGLELASRIAPNKTYLAAAGVALAAAFILVWVNLAVGIIGNEENPANLMYYGVLAVGIFGTIIARCRPNAMARVMVTTAIAQVLVAIIALFAGLGYTFALTGFFVALWLASAWLFNKCYLETTSQP